MFKGKLDEREFENALDEYLNELIMEIFKKSQENIVKVGAVDTGFLLRSGEVDISRKNKKSITYSVPYATAIEYGLEPFTANPPLEKIKEWAKRKLGLDEKEANRAAFLIKRKIYEKGTDPKSFLRNAVDEVKEKL